MQLDVYGVQCKVEITSRKNNFLKKLHLGMGHGWKTKFQLENRDAYLETILELIRFCLWN